MKERMSTETLMDILLTRIKSNDNNPTSGSFLYDLYKALEKSKAIRRQRVFKSRLTKSKLEYFIKPNQSNLNVLCDLLFRTSSLSC